MGQILVNILRTVAMPDLHWSTNPNAIGKLPKGQGWRSTKGWEFKSGPIDELLDDLLVKGQALNWCELAGGYREKGNVLSSWGFGIDIDNDDGSEGLTVEQAREDPVWGSANICYPSPSYGLPGKGERFRLLWFCPEGIDPAEAKSLQVGMMQFTPGIDRACKAAHNVWYGRENTEPFWVNPEFSFNRPNFDSRLSAHLSTREQRKTPSGVGALRNDYDPIIDGAFEDLEGKAIRLLRRIPQRVHGGGTYGGAKNTLIILISTFGAELTKELCDRAQWHGEWDRDSVIDSLADWLSDNEPDPDEALGWGYLHWLASDANPARL